MSDGKLKNRAVCIGYLSDRTLYLNVSREEAISRHLAAGRDSEVTDSMVDEFLYDDEISVYSAGPMTAEGWVDA